MFRKSFVALLFAAIMFTLIPVQGAFAKDTSAPAQLVGNWKITHRPVNESGQPCPFLPETIQFLKDQTLIMSNLPGRALPFKTELTAAEKSAMIERTDAYKGKSLLLVKPIPQMDWSATPMVYIYSVSKDTLSLTVEGWEPAAFSRVK